MTRHKEQAFLKLNCVLIPALLAMVSIGCQSTQHGQATAQAASTSAGPTRAEGTEQTAGQSTPKEGQSEEDKTLLAVSKAIRKNHLTDRNDECLTYQFDRNPGQEFYSVEVRENHHYAKCGGDPNTSPRLFTVKVSKKSGKMTTDQGSPAGTFRRLAD